MPITKGFRALVDEAMGHITTLSLDEAQAARDDPNVLLVDLRDIRELWLSGTIPGSVHAPRGMLEFWVDPESPYHRKVFGEGKRLVLFCAAAWRSALEAEQLQRMGLTNVAHVEGGFEAWKAAGLPVEPVTVKLPKGVTMNEALA